VTLSAHPIGSEWQWSPNPAKHQLFNLDYSEPSRAIMVDLLQPNTVVKLFDGAVPFSVSPLGNLLTYVDKPKVQVVSVSAPDALPATIDTYTFGYYPPVATWSPDGAFISVTDDLHQQLLVRIDGAQLSTPVPLQGTSNANIYGAWQP
jgi:hypothetical protein